MKLTQKPTDRQKKLLTELYNFSKANGTPPTINNLCEILSEYPQTIVNELDWLEGMSLIKERSSKRARNIQISQEGARCIGIRHPIGITDLPTDPFKLSEKQNRVYQSLQSTNKKTADWYKGAVRTLTDTANDDRLAQSAHSLREITHHISRMGKAFMEEAAIKGGKEAKTNNSRQLEACFEPMGLTPILRDKTIYSIWDSRYHKYFLKVSHHEIEPNPDEFADFLEDFENFLLQYIFSHQVDIYNRINTITEMDSLDVDVTELTLILSKNVESHRYFFERVSETWLQFLDHKKILKDFPTPHMGQYLVRCAKKSPKKVIEIIKKYHIEPSRLYLKESFVNCALNMPKRSRPFIVKRIVKDKWLEIENPQFTSLAYICNELLKKLIEEGQYGYTVILAKELLKLYPKKINYTRTIYDIRGYVEDYTYQDICSLITSNIPIEEIPKFIIMFAGLLNDLCLLLTDNGKKYHHIFWDPIYEKKERAMRHIDDLIISTMCALLSKYVQFEIDQKKIDIAEIPDRLLNNIDQKFDISKRIKLHIYRLYPETFRAKIETSIISGFYDDGVTYEYDYLLLETFGDLSKTIKEEYIELTKTGPKEKKSDKDSIRFWKIGKLAPIKEYLKESDLKSYKDLLINGREPSIPFTRYPMASFVGPKTPKNKDELSELNIQSLVELLKTWKPQPGLGKPCRVGLGRELAELIKSKVPHFSAHAMDFSDSDLRPVYLYEFFSGLRSGLNDAESIEWGPIIDLGYQLTQKAKSGKLSQFSQDEKNDWGITWDTMFSWLASLIQDGLNHGKLEIDHKHRNKIFEIIKHVCSAKEPTVEYEKKFAGNNDNLYSLSINSVRGNGFHALFSYILWCMRLNRKENLPTIVPKEANIILEEHLNIEIEPTLTIRSVYGYYFPILYPLDPKTTSKWIDRLFPIDDKQRRYAAWEMYLSRGIYESTYEKIKPFYQKAILELKELPKKEYARDPGEGVGRHLMIALANGIEKPESRIIKTFTDNATEEQMKSIIRFTGTNYLMRAADESSKLELINIIRFWENTLSTFKNKDILREFGWWINTNNIENKQLLELLLKTLKKTAGAIGGDYHVYKKLLETSKDPESALITSKCLLLIISSRENRKHNYRLGAGGNIEDILTELQKAKDNHIDTNVNKMVHYLTSLGHERYKKFHTNNTTFPSLEEVKSLDAGLANE